MIAGSTLTRKDAALLALLALGALGIRLYFLQFYDVISNDGITYVNIAKEFIAGRGLATATHYPPFFPILVGLASTLCPDFETAGLAVSAVMGSLLVVPVYLLGAEFFSTRVGFVAAVLSVTWPSLRYWSTQVMSQATYITLLLMGVYLLWRAYRKNALLASVLAGLCFAGAHLTRSEGVLVFFCEIGVLVLYTFANRLPARKLLYLLLSLAVFCLAFSPYLLLLHELSGKWQLTGKSKVAIADALSEYLGKPDIKHDPKFQELGYLDLFRLYPEYVRTNYLKNLKACWHDMLPLYGWLLVGIGLIAGALNREKLWERAYLLATFAPLVIIVVFFFIGPEYTQAYLPVLLLLAGQGLFQVQKWALQGIGAAPTGSLARYAWCAPVLLALLYGSWNVVSQLPPDRNLPYDYNKDGGRFDDKRVGQKLSKTLPAGAVIMTRSGRIGFYSGHRWMVPPQADYAEIIQNARKNGADYLVATVQLLNLRPQLEFLYGPILDPGHPFTPPPELELVAVDQLPGGLPYILYHVRR
jgi:4-amino-4-deoxy-L-arabinose transferase-like glycosyltransferase